MQAGHKLDVFDGLTYVCSFGTLLSYFVILIVLQPRRPCQHLLLLTSITHSLRRDEPHVRL